MTVMSYLILTSVFLLISVAFSAMVTLASAFLIAFWLAGGAVEPWTWQVLAGSWGVVAILWVLVVLLYWAENR